MAYSRGDNLLAGHDGSWRLHTQEMERELKQEAEREAQETRPYEVNLGIDKSGIPRVP
jgi:hypothetical protein